MGGADQYQCLETLALCFDAALPTVRSIFTVAVRMSFSGVMLGHWYFLLLRGTFKRVIWVQRGEEIALLCPARKKLTSSTRSESEALTGLIRCFQTGDSHSCFSGSSAELRAFRPLRENLVTHSNTQACFLVHMGGSLNAPPKKQDTQDQLSLILSEDHCLKNKTGNKRVSIRKKQWDLDTWL